MFNNKELSELLEAKVTDDAVYFLGGPLSNFFQSRVRYDNKSFMTSEHAYMYAKAVYFRDQTAVRHIMLAETPAEAKRIGRLVRNFDQEVWNDVSYQIMLDINTEKYTNSVLREVLLHTGTRELVECNGRDRIWGIGLYNSSGKIYDKSQWNGKNWLGEVLMTVRSNALK